MDGPIRLTGQVGWLTAQVDVRFASSLLRPGTNKNSSVIFDEIEMKGAAFVGPIMAYIWSLRIMIYIKLRLGFGNGNGCPNDYNECSDIGSYD